MHPLPPERRAAAMHALADAQINHLFADVVLAGEAPGRVFTDDPDRPRSFYVAHDYGMSLLFGEPGDEAFLASLRAFVIDEQGERSGPEWLQVYPGEWATVLEELLGDALQPMKGLCPQPEEPGLVVQCTRVNFRFDPTRFMAFEAGLPPPALPVRPMDAAAFENAPGAVVPARFWRDAGHFLSEGMGFSAMDGDYPAATAFSAYRRGKLLELGIETAPNYRRQGLALQVATSLIRYCLEQGLEPVWACRFDNQASYRLATTLGFVPTLHLPYYRLPRGGGR